MTNSYNGLFTDKRKTTMGLKIEKPIRSLQHNESVPLANPNLFRIKAIDVVLFPIQEPHVFF